MNWVKKSLLLRCWNQLKELLNLSNRDIPIWFDSNARIYEYNYYKLDVAFLDASSHLYKLPCPSVGRLVHPSVRPSVGPSVRPSVRPSVHPSVTPVQKPRFSAVFGHDEILHWNKWSTIMFWESSHPSVRPFVTPYICQMINTRWNKAQTHRCPVGLV